MSWSTRLATVAGIDIKVHATFLLVLAFGAYTLGGTGGWQGALFGLLLTLLLFGSVALHELGHSLVAKAVGVRVKEIVLLPIGGVAVMLGRPRKAWHELVISLAGPAVNVALAFGLGAFAIMGLWSGMLDIHDLRLTDSVEPSLAALVAWLLTANLTLAVFNMVPAFPMDGGRVLRALLAMLIGHDRASGFATRLGQVLAVALGGFGLIAGNPMLALVGIFVFLGASQERVAEASRQALSGLRVGDVTERASFALSSWQRVGDVAMATVGFPQRYYPVFDGNTIVGVLSRDAMMAAVAAGGVNLLVRDVMDDHVLRVREWDTVEDVLDRMQAAEARVAIVAGRDRWVGMLSHEHALQAAQLLMVLRAAQAVPVVGPAVSLRA